MGGSAEASFPAGVQASLEVQAKSHSGPIPSPETLALYGQVDPSFPGMIFERARTEQAHRHAQENKLVDAQIADSRGVRAERARGQWLGAFVSLAFLGGAVYLGVNDQATLGGILGGATLLGIVTVIVTASRAKGGGEQDSN